MTEIISADLMSTDYVKTKDPKTGQAEPVLFWFLRDINGNRIKRKIRGFKPYAYASEPVGRATEDLFGRKIYYWEAQLPGQIGSGRGMYDYTCEADILFPLRAIIDWNVYCGVEIEDNVFRPVDSHNISPKVMLFDFEFYSPPEIMPKPIEPIWPCVSQQWMVADEGVIRVNVLNFNDLRQAPEGALDESVISEKAQKRRIGIWRKFTNITVELTDGSKLSFPVEVRWFNNERDMWLDFAKRAVDEPDVDVPTGYNVVNYDWPQLFRRAKVLGVHRSIPEYLSPLREAHCRWNEQRGRWDTQIKGRSLLDLGDIYKKYVKPVGERTSYDLKIVVADECKFAYDDLGDRIKPSYDKDPQAFIEYAAKDVIALKLLNEKCDLVPYIDVLRRTSGALFDKALSNKVLVDTVCLRLTDKPLPTGRKQIKEKKAKGALVIRPIPRLHEWVILLDLKSIYPVMMMAFNLSPECKFIGKEPKDMENYNAIPIVDNDGRTVRTIYYKKSPQGILAKVAEHMMALREHYREYGRKLESQEGYDKRYREVISKQETVAKFIACSINGVLAYPGFRLYDPDVFESVTSITRMAVFKVIEVLKPYGWEVIYGDTDSIFVKLKSKNKEDAVAEGFEVERIVQEFITEWTKSLGAIYPIDIKFEYLFDSILWKKRAKGEDPAKKRYGGHYVMKNGEWKSGMKIVGLEPKSSAAARYTRDLMERFLIRVLQDKDVPGAVTILANAWDKMEKVDHIAKIGIPKGLHKHLTAYEGTGVQPWAHGVMNAMKVFGWRFSEDEKPKLIYTIPTSVFPYHELCVMEDTKVLPEGVRIDWSVQREKVIKDKFLELLEAVGKQWSEIEHGIIQAGLDRWVADDN